MKNYYSEQLPQGSLSTVNSYCNDELIQRKVTSITGNIENSYYSEQLL